jgi:hypothetical protein
MSDGKTIEQRRAEDQFERKVNKRIFIDVLESMIDLNDEDLDDVADDYEGVEATDLIKEYKKTDVECKKILALFEETDKDTLTWFLEILEGDMDNRRKDAIEYIAK